MPHWRQAFRKEAGRLDRTDPLRRFRKRFHAPQETVYLDGNSLGLLSKDSERTVHEALASWRELGVRGWLEADPPWFYLAETVGARCAKLVGAEADEVVMTGTTTVNIHALVNTFYNPSAGRTRIIADELDFPTDIYALKSVLRRCGLEPAKHLVLVRSRDGRTINEDDVVRAMDSTTALVFLPSVLYRSGQLLDMEYLTLEAHKRNIPVGFDCSHSAGVVPHELSAWGVDFAVWCGYKYLNGGPGATAFLYLNRRHFSREPSLAGWFGSIKERQFDMSLDFEPARSAGGWQISSPSILSASPLLGALAIHEEAGIGPVRDKSLKMTRFLMEMTDGWLGPEPYGFSVGTPREDRRRGGHVSLIHPEAMRIAEALRGRGVVPDFRPPDMLRIAPVPLYNTFTELWGLALHIGDIIDRREYERYPRERKPVS